MSKPPEKKEFPPEVKAELRELGALVVSQSIVLFKTGTEPKSKRLQELGLVFDRECDGRTWYEYKPTTTDG